MACSSCVLKWKTCKSESSVVPFHYSLDLLACGISAFIFLVNLFFLVEVCKDKFYCTYLDVQ